MAKMTKPIIVIHDTETGELIEREMTEAEYAEVIERESFAAQALAETAAREIAREATIAKLAALGLTPEDLAAL